jgi:hypothetical protein
MHLNEYHELQTMFDTALKEKILAIPKKEAPTKPRHQSPMKKGEVRIG